MKAFNFDRFRRRVLMAEGITVHADSLPEAQEKAARFLAAYPVGDSIVFVGNRPCGAWCSKCRADPAVSHQNQSAMRSEAEPLPNPSKGQET